MTSLEKRLISKIYVFCRHLGITPLQTLDIREWWIDALRQMNKETIDILCENFAESSC